MMTDACLRWAELSDREAVGDALAPSEAEFMRLHASSCEACRAEASLYGAMRTLVDEPTPPERAPLAPPEAPRRTRRVRAFAVAAAAVAVAASIAVAVGTRATPPSGGLVGAAPKAAAKAAVTLTSGAGVEVDGRPVRAGASLARGNVVVARTERACLTVEPSVRVCLARGTLLRVDDTGANRRLALLGGKLVAELDPQPAGTSFGVTTRDGSAVAVGTAFSVEVLPGDAPVVTRVLHGTVAVRSSDGAEHLVHAHEAAAMRDAPTPLAAEDEARERRLLEDGARDDVGPASVTSAPPPPPVTAPVVAAPAPEQPATLLVAARERRARGDVDGASAAYRDLFARHPSSVEAHAALVPYGDLQLGALADANGALASFDAYLARGGPLAEEASFGRIRALRSLGRSADERAAVDAFLVRFPKGPLAATLRAREER